jgi:hypothetical protein
MTTPRNEVFLSLGDGDGNGAEGALTVTPVPPAPAPPAPTAGLAEIVSDASNVTKHHTLNLETGEETVVDVSVEQVEVDVDVDVDTELERVKKKYIEKAKRQTLERYEIQENKRAPRIQIDQRVVLAGWIFSVAVAFLTSAIVSFNGITSVAVFVGLSQAWMAYLFFFFIELMYLLFLLAYLILSSRTTADGQRERTWGAIAGMTFFAAVAVLANAFHTFDYWEWNFVEPRAWAGFVLSISAPLAIISISKMASRVVFARSVDIS